MAVQEKSWGPFYFAHVELNQETCPLHLVSVVEMKAPWRTGRALVVPWDWWHAVVIGLWFPNLKKVDPEFEDDRWFNPRWQPILGAWDGDLEEEAACRGGTRCQVEEAGRIGPRGGLDYLE